MRKIAVLTSGGDAPGMNACIRAIVNTAWQKGIEVIGYRHGFRGILENLTQPLHPNDMRLQSQRGGTFLKSARYPQFKQAQVGQAAAAKLTEQGIEGLIIIGGDGSLQGAHHLAQFWTGQIIAVPGTIDNDLTGTDVAIGFSTAVDTAVDAIDRIRETAEAMARVFIIEVMGRRAGFIGLHAAIAGAAEAMILPEMDPQPNMAELAKKIQEARTNFPDSSYLIILSENLWPGGVQGLATNLTRATGVTCHPCPLGHIQRGGRPNAQDRILAMQLGHAAVEALLANQTNIMVAYCQERITEVPIAKTFEKNKALNSALIQLQFSLQGLNSASQFNP